MIGAEFKARREALGLDQKELAQRLCVGQSLISRVEAGLKTPSVPLVKLAAELFGCTTDELIFGREAGDRGGQAQVRPQGGPAVRAGPGG